MMMDKKKYLVIKESTCIIIVLKIFYIVFHNIVGQMKLEKKHLIQQIMKIL